MTTQIEGYRLSPQQERLWILQENDSSHPYRVQIQVRIEGNLDLEILKVALKKVIDRHEILRTKFHCLSGMTVPLQAIDLDCDYNLSELDLSSAETKVEQLWQQLKAKPFNLGQAALLSVILAKQTSNQHTLLLSLPAVCGDAKTLTNLVKEIGEVYAVISQGKELEDEEALQYADLAEWLSDLLEDEETAEGRNYWLKQDFSNVVRFRLPQEKRSPKKQSFKPQIETLIIEPELVDKISNLAEKYHTSIADFCSTCWQILLWRLGDCSQVIIGDRGNYRDKYEELETALGLLAIHFPLKRNLAAESSFQEVWQQTRDLIQETKELQEYFVPEDLNISGDGFPYTFSFVKDSSSYQINDFNFVTERQYECLTRFKIKLVCRQQDNRLLVDFYYDRNYFDLETITRIKEQWKALVVDAVANPKAAIGSLNILGEKERQQLLIDFNQTKSNFEPVLCIHKLFKAQVEKTPNAIAIAFEDKQLTYAELNNLADRLAKYLKKLNVGSEVLVGLEAEKDLTTIIGILAILKAGGAYLPLEPKLPKERQEYMIGDAQAALILTQEKIKDICLAEDSNAEDLYKDIALDNEVNIDNLAYVIYTSGSTGKPKGVAVEHQQLFNYTNAISEQLQLEHGANFAMVSTFAADLGNTAIFPTLCGGGCLHIIADDCVKDPNAFADYCRDRDIDYLKIVPSHLAALLSSDRPETLPHQCLVLGGEPLSQKLVEKIQKLAPKCKIINHYGPTESTVGILTYLVKKNSVKQNTATVPIGRPLANNQVYVLDSEQKLVPIGVTGELYVGGANLTRGYLNQSQLTAERFIENPFSNKPEDRLYKTGDLVRYLPDGDIEFIGRIDNQIKLRGFRIELGEIEAALNQYSTVETAIVLVREDRRLIAYLMTTEKTGLETEKLPSFLAKQLPDYMIPNVFVCLESFPLTANGKIDRQALPAPEDIIDSQTSFVPPKTPTEKILVDIWCQLLNLEEVGVRDNFFELGGDSIICIQVIAKAKQAGLTLTPAQLFQHQTIAELAKAANTVETISAEQGLVTGKVFLTPIQKRFFEQNIPNPHHWNQSVLLEVKETLDKTFLEKAIATLLKHHDALRSRYQKKEQEWSQIIDSTDNNIPLTCLDLSDLSESEQKNTIESTANKLQTRLNLATGSLLQVAWFNLGTYKLDRLLIIVHHLAIDGVSWRILLEDLETIYRQQTLPAKTTSFKQWSSQLNNYAQSKELPAQKQYWLEKIAKPCINLPVDNHTENNAIADTKIISVTLSQAETKALLQEVPQVYQTQIDDVLLTALVQGFEQWTGYPYLLVDLESHGRDATFTDLDLSRTVGWFTSIFPARLVLKDNVSPGEALKAIKEQLISIPNRGISYGILRYLNEDSAIKALPQPQVIFNYLGQFDQVTSESALWSIAKENKGLGRNPQAERAYLLEINGLIVGGKLRFDWTYSEKIHHRETVLTTASVCLQKLKELITHCQSNDVGSYTPSDFPDANLNQADLDRLMSKLGS